MSLGRNFNTLWLAYTISIIGDWAFRIAIPLVVYDLTGSPILMATAYAATFAPFILIMPIAGVIADAYNRHRLLWLSDLVSAVVAVAITAYLSTTSPNIYLILPGLVILGAMASVSHPAFQGFLPSTVESGDLAKANSYIATSDSIFNMIAPAFGGALVAMVGALSVLWLNSASFLVSMGLILAIKARPQEITDHLRLRSVFSSLHDGLNVAMSYPIIKWGTVLFILVNFSSHLVLGNIIYFLTEQMGLTPDIAGYVLGASAAGGLIGALIAPRFLGRIHPGRFMLLCVGLSACGTLFLVAGPTYGVLPVLLGRALTMGAEAAIVVTMFTERQRLVPPSHLSRAVGITRTISYVPVPIAAVLGGYLIALNQGDMRFAIYLSAAVLLLCTLLGLFTPFIKSPASGRPATR